MGIVIRKGLQNSVHSRPKSVVQQFLETARYSSRKATYNESHFNVSIGSDGQSHKTVSTNHNLFEEKEKPKWYRTEVLPLTSLMPYR